MTNNDTYIEKAKRYYKIGLDEIDKSKGNGEIEYAVDGCEKGWLAIVLATNALFLSKGIKEDKLPNTHRGRRFFLSKYGTRNLRRIFSASYGTLHIDAFYDQLIDFKEIAETMDDVKKYIDTVEND